MITPLTELKASLKFLLFLLFPYSENDITILPVAQSRNNEAMLDFRYLHCINISHVFLKSFYFFWTQSYNPCQYSQLMWHKLI